MKNIEVHLSSLQNGETALVAGSEKAFEKYNAELTRYADRITTLDITDIDTVQPEQFSAILSLSSAPILWKRTRTIPSAISSKNGASPLYSGRMNGD